VSGQATLGAAAATLSGTVVDATGAPLAGVVVSSAGVGKATSAADGTFSVPVAVGPSLVTFEAPDFMGRALRVDASPGAPLARVVSLLARSKAQTLDAAAGGTIQGPRGASLSVPPAAFVDANGEPITGSVAVALTPIDWGLAAERAAFPASLAAHTTLGDERFLEMHGALEIDVRKDGAPVSVAAGTTLAALVPASGVAPSITAGTLFRLDAAQGVWIELGDENAANADASGKGFAVTAAQTGVIGVAVPSAPACFHGRVVDGAGQPVGWAVVLATSDDGTSGGEAIAGFDGTFCLPMARATGAILSVHRGWSSPSVEPTTSHAGGPAKRLPSLAYQCATDCDDVGDLMAADAEGGTDASPDASSDSSGGALSDVTGLDTTPRDVASSCGIVKNFLATVPSPSATCANHLSGFIGCFSPSGGCSRQSTGTLSSTVVWSDNASLLWRDSMTSLVGTYYGAGMTLCGAITVYSATPPVLMDTLGHTFTLEPLDSGATSVDCGAMGHFEVSVEVTHALFACLGLLENCAGDNHGPVGCQSNTTCAFPRHYCCPSAYGNTCVHDAVECADYQANGCTSSSPCPATKPLCCAGVYRTCRIGPSCTN
jgi:hypothetical protein